MRYMGLLKDFYQHNLTIRKLYWPREILNLANWGRIIKWRRQRMERGWSDRDTWGGGEYIASVAYGILMYLQYEQHMVDVNSDDDVWKFNFPDDYGYKSLGEVAQDIDNYIYWQENQYSEPLYSEFVKDHGETSWEMEYQLYSDYKNAMHFVAENIGGLWW